MRGTAKDTGEESDMHAAPPRRLLLTASRQSTIHRRARRALLAPCTHHDGQGLGERHVAADHLKQVQLLLRQHVCGRVEQKGRNRERG